ncbi:hypothetical protein PF004_g16531, partial [Phytophthora fragariae]
TSLFGTNTFVLRTEFGTSPSVSCGDRHPLGPGAQRGDDAKRVMEPEVATQFGYSLVGVLHLYPVYVLWKKESADKDPPTGSHKDSLAAAGSGGRSEEDWHSHSSAKALVEVRGVRAVGAASSQQLKTIFDSEQPRWSREILDVRGRGEPTEEFNVWLGRAELERVVWGERRVTAGLTGGRSPQRSLCK